MTADGLNSLRRIPVLALTQTPTDLLASALEQRTRHLWYFLNVIEAMSPRRVPR